MNQLPQFCQGCNAPLSDRVIVLHRVKVKGEIHAEYHLCEECLESVRACMASEKDWRLFLNIARVKTLIFGEENL